MEYISISHLHNNVVRQYGKQKHLKGKISNYFNTFINKHTDYEYGWVENKVYVPITNEWQIKKELERMLNKSIRPIQSKLFGVNFKMELYTHQEINTFLSALAIQKQEQLDIKHKAIKDEFEAAYNYIEEDNKDGFKTIGAFDLEFWEKNSDIILEFGWSIKECDVITTKHIIVRENIKYENGIYAPNNRNIRNDSVTMSLKEALKVFKTEFMDYVDIIIGHGLESDCKVLATNGFNMDKPYLDTSDIGSAVMGEADKVGLERLLNYLEIEHKFLHNAACDAEYVIDVFFKMGEKNG